MKKIQIITEHKSILPYLLSHNLLPQYKKAKNFILSGQENVVDFKLRKPKKDKIYYFRINKQYRAFCYKEESVLRVFKISDHQN